MAKANKLWTATAFKKVPALYATEHDDEETKVAHVKIFSALSDHRHYVIEYDPKTTEAYVLTTNLDVCEYGTILLSELQGMNDNFRQEDPQRPGHRRWIMPPWERELTHGASTAYKMADIKAAHERRYNPDAWAARIADGKAKAIEV